MLRAIDDLVDPLTLHSKAAPDLGLRYAELVKAHDDGPALAVFFEFFLSHGRNPITARKDLSNVNP